MTTLLPAEIEALTLFLRDRSELCTIHARSCGVADPARVPRWLAESHREQVFRLAKGKPPGRKL